MKNVKYLLPIILCVNLFGCNSLPQSFRPKNINDKVYVLPHKVVEIPKVQTLLDMPAPAEDTKPNKGFVIKTASTDLTQPPAQYQQPAETAPVGVMGEDEELKQMRNAPNPNINPSKESIWGKSTKH